MRALQVISVMKAHVDICVLGTEQGRPTCPTLTLCYNES